jgi:hypothetical protein
MDEKSERLQILEMIENGLISAEEGISLLSALAHEGQRSGAESSPGPAKYSVQTSTPVPEPVEGSTGFEADGSSPETESIDLDLSRWRRWWMIPMWVGVGITVAGAGLMYWALQATGTSLWFACAWLPFLLGLGVLALAWGSRSARWLHIRVHKSKGGRVENVAISFPLPIRLARWFLKNFGHHIPRLKDTGIDEIILALEDNTSPDAPFYLEVDEGEGGEQVQIYLG